MATAAAFLNVGASAIVPAVAIGLNWSRATSSAGWVVMVPRLIVNFSIKAFNPVVPTMLIPSRSAGGSLGGSLA